MTAHSELKQHCAFLDNRIDTVTKQKVSLEVDLREKKQTINELNEVIVVKDKEIKYVAEKVNKLISTNNDRLYSLLSVAIQTEPLVKAVAIQTEFVCPPVSNLLKIIL